MNIKTLYEFSIDVEKEIEKVETKNENGTETTIKTKVKESVPVYFAFKKASRNERESAEEYRVAVWGKAVERGILPQAIIAKQYSNYGGIFSETQKKEYNELLETVSNKRKEYETSDDINKERLKIEIQKLGEKIMEFENSQSEFFINSAEAKARNKTIEWLVLNLSFTRDDNTKEWKPFFLGDSLEKKYESLEKMEEEESEFYIKTRERLMFVAAMYLALGNSIKKEDIDSLYNI